ncbi:MAG: peptidylprolyl isomerase [Eggerthellaceae bacterium]|nr:peptidylprolyl isomerase [Eggerthellaceae bacterium]
MKSAPVIKAACAAGLAIACFCGVAACSSGDSQDGLTGGVAATVNGTEIQEDDITTAIQNMRSSYSLDDQDAWGQYLASSGTTPEQLRENVVDSFVDQELQKQGADERGVSVSDDDINTVVDGIKANYDTDEKWQQALTQAGFESEDDYRETVRDGLLSNKLMDSFEATDPTDEEVVAYASENITFDSSKRSSHILFDTNDQETAQSVLDQINAGEIDFATAASQYSTDTASAANGGDVGWDQLSSFVDEYQTALDGLAVGQVSGLVQSDYGWHIIMCTDEFVVPEEITSIDQLPSEFADSYRETLRSQSQQEAYQAWFDEYKEGADIVINDMPDGLPYVVDMSQYQTDDGSVDASSDESADETAEDGASEADAAATDEAGATDDAAAADGAAEEGAEQDADAA